MRMPPYAFNLIEKNVDFIKNKKYKEPNGLQAFRMIDQKAIDDGVHMN